MTGYAYGDFTIPTDYVTAADVATWMGMVDAEGTPQTAQLPDTILPTIRACTRLVLKATMGAFYDADPDTGLPTEPKALQALQDATCIQAAAWVTLDINPFLAGVAEAGAVQTGTKLGTAALTFADAPLAAAARQRAQVALVPEAAQLLGLHNLLGTSVWSFG